MPTKKTSLLPPLTAEQTADNDSIIGIDRSVPRTITWTITEFAKRLSRIFVTGPISAPDHALAAFEGTTGKELHATDVTHQDVGRTLATGLISGGVVAPSATPGSFELGAGSGIVVDSASDPLNPTVARVSWPKQTVTLADPASGRTYVAIDKAGGVVQQYEDWTGANARDLIFLARISHVGGVIQAAAMRPNLAFGTAGALNDLADAVGPLNLSGNKVAPIPGTLQLSRTKGRIFRLGSYYPTDPRSPNVTPTPAQSPLSWLVQYRNGSGGWNRLLNQNTVNPNVYDDGSGTLASVQAQKWTIQRIWHFSAGITVLMPGQRTYSSLAECDANRTRSDFVYDAASYDANAVFLGWLMVQQNTTDLSNTTKCVWVQAGKFGL